MSRAETGKGKIVRFTGTLLALTVLGTSTAWAGEWKLQEDNRWTYEEDGTTVTGWIQDDGTWYYMESETGLWNPHPALTQENVCKLLENAVNRAGWYRNEEAAVVYKLDSVGKRYITASVMSQPDPLGPRSTLNTFDIDMKTGKAKSQSTKLVLDLYQ